MGELESAELCKRLGGGFGGGLGGGSGFGGFVGGALDFFFEVHALRVELGG